MYICLNIKILKVCIPLMILPLLCAAYAEVNAEGKRLLKVNYKIYCIVWGRWILVKNLHLLILRQCICPAEQRLNALYVMWQSPPQMNVFGKSLLKINMLTWKCQFRIHLLCSRLTMLICCFFSFSTKARQLLTEQWLLQLLVFF